MISLEDYKSEYASRNLNESENKSSQIIKKRKCRFNTILKESRMKI